MLNILIPCAGQARRFQEAGYSEIKPFIMCNGRMMIEWVIQNFISTSKEQEFTFIFQQEHIDKHNVIAIMFDIAKSYNIKHNIVAINGLTQGSACTIYQARNKIDLDKELVIANSDQYVSNFDIDRFIGWAGKDDCSILTFNDTDSKWSFVEPLNEVYAKNVKEKEPVSNIANVGVFYYKEGRDAMWAIKEMISKGIKIGNEYYLAPSINELIEDHAKVSYKLLEPYQKMWGLGTPFDHKNFEDNYTSLI